MSDTKQILEAYAELEQACIAFGRALGKFQKVYDPNTVGLTELAEQIDEVLADIDSELDGYGRNTV